MSKHLDIVWTNQFKKDYKLAMKRHLDIDLLDDIIRKLASSEQLPEKNKDHALTGNWIGHRECHIQPDWLLVYRIENGLDIIPNRNAQRFIWKVRKCTRYKCLICRVHFSFCINEKVSVIFRVENGNVNNKLEKVE